MQEAQNKDLGAVLAESSMRAPGAGAVWNYSFTQDRSVKI